MQRELLGSTNVDFNAPYQLLVLLSTFVKYVRKNRVFIDFRKLLIQLGSKSCIIFSLSLVSY